MPQSYHERTDSDPSANEDSNKPMANSHPTSVDEGSYQQNGNCYSASDDFTDSQNYDESLRRRSVLYNWRLYSPNDNSLTHFLRWLCVGGALFADQSDEDRHVNLAGLARCIILLRQYLDTYGMPDRGGPKEQELVLREVARDLYAGGAPLWALESILQKAAEGMTGHKNTNWFLLPRKAFVFFPLAGEGGMTSMFSMTRGFNISKLTDMERVAVRLSSFASNTSGVGDVPSRFPTFEEFSRVARTESLRTFQVPDAETLAKQILFLASTTQGLFFFVNSRQYVEKRTELDSFWVISDEERELFSRLATIEGLRLIEEMDANKKQLYSPITIVSFRLLASAGACGFWFNGSWQDMVIAGILAIAIAFIAESKVLSRQEKIIYEIVASFMVGISSGLIALTWPDYTCFGAMAIAGVLDILQGFRVVYAVIETMSKHTVSGGADLLEGILYTGLIAYFLRFGRYTASSILKHADSSMNFDTCSNGINPYWYLFWVPVAAFSWSGLFTPDHRDLIPMMLHGCLAYGVNYWLAQASVAEELNNFLSALSVTLSAGIYSRFSGRQAVGNTVAGLYVVLPGAYLVKSLYGSSKIDNGFFSDIVQKAVIIGVGAWTGSLLCSPTLLGTTRGVSSQQHEQSRRDSAVHPVTMLSF